MAQIISDRQDQEFVLYEQFKADELIRHEKYSDFNKKSFDMIISEARKFAIDVLQPTYAQGDKEGATYENGSVKAPECFREPYRLIRENGWMSLTEDLESGGQGLPHTIAMAAYEFLKGANYPLFSFPGAASGAGLMIEAFGSDKQKELFVKKMFTGEWGGSMQMTEPQAGTDVGALTTTAVKNEDGTYSLTGNKIFITVGDHDLTENIIHPVLARIEGAPKGTKGISLFLVPKIWVNDDGSLGEPNDMVCTGLEEKMGLHGSPTCSMSMGGKAKCRGLLMGKENEGLKVMFHMMNGARLEIGSQGLFLASAAYLDALNYAKERLQGRDAERSRDVDAPSVPIINHPDVRRMLIKMKAYVEGMRSFVYYLANCFDKIECSDIAGEKDRYATLAELLTPVVKAYNTDIGFEVCIDAIQVYGGYGYTKEFLVEQYARDLKIGSIYEGTNGVQAIDLLGRKLGLDGGQAFKDFLGEIMEVVIPAKEIKGLGAWAGKVEEVVNELGRLAAHLGKTFMSADFKVALANATPFLEVMGDTVMGWMWLWRASIAARNLEEGPKKKKISYYQGQLKTAEYFIDSILPITLGKMEAIRNGGSAVVEISKDSF